MSDDTTRAHDPRAASPSSPGSVLALALAWSAHEPDRMGEVALLGGSGPTVLGRTGDLAFVRHRPRDREPTGPLTDPAISREQLILEPAGNRVRMRSVGRLTTRVAGIPTEETELRAGDVIELGDRAVLVVHNRPEVLQGTRSTHPFGRADAQGLVGEGPAAWELRSRLAFLAPRKAHVLVRGESGTGKELAARALHVLSGRSRGPLVSRSAATIPESLADAELFGNLANYPNPGMAARPGLVGEADGGTLFLDEFGELPIEIQARLLRVLDAGEYTRLGEAKPRTSNLRLVAATNRPLDALKHDVLARLPLRIEMPPLGHRREDLGLLAFHLLRDIARQDADVARRFFEGGDAARAPRLTSRLVAALVAHPYRTHVRELTALLWRAIGEATGETLDLFPGYAELLDAPSPMPVGPVDPARLTPEAIQACLDRHGGRQELAWRELGLASRHVLARLVTKHDLKVRGR